jgi:organic hydroperoxide reductase OsmC/OhrA
MYGQLLTINFKDMETYFETKVQWESEKKGWLISNGPVPLETASYKNHPGLWSPENLFVAAVNISFMQCFLEVCVHVGIPVLFYDSNATGLSEILEGKKMITEIIIEPKILIPDDTDFNTVLKCIESAERSNIISNSMSSKIIVQPKIDYKILEEII